MIDWNSPNWGGGVTFAANGSWVADKHNQQAVCDEDEAS